jgi:lipid II:glycine glycyltransferase (peptidoglycan interpeptide bridge formation enzyme)
VLTGKRGVSLPFADICSPLVKHGDRSDLYRAAVEQGRERGWRYLECRGDTPGWQDATEAVSFFAHTLDLGGPLDQLFNQMESPVRRAVRKAEASGLRLEFRTDEASVQAYYRMHCRTRQRHGLPPQPIRFFQSIRTHVLEKAHGFVALAFAEQTPIAGAVFLHFGRKAIYKFGASLEEYQHLRPNSFLMWRVMQHLSKQGFHQLHFGRTSVFNQGLRRFKLGFGSREVTRSYARFDFQKAMFVQAADHSSTWANRLFRACPLAVLRLAGRALYPHLS